MTEMIGWNFMTANKKTEKFIEMMWHDENKNKSMAPSQGTQNT